mgnify:CR=1 FL=1
MWDGASGAWAVPNGSLGFRWSEEGRWNLKPEDSLSGRPVDPQLTFAEEAEEWVTALTPFFAGSGSTALHSGRVPVRRLRGAAGELTVTTVFDLLAAHLGVVRDERTGSIAMERAPGADPAPYTPQWQEAVTGVPAAQLEQVAREFAANAAQTGGKSMIFLGAGTHHWFHSDTIYRSILLLTTLCGCQGVNGGGWAHYVGQEKVRTQAGWSQLAFALDWRRPPQLQNGTSLWYFATGQFRYDTLDVHALLSPAAEPGLPRHPADCNVIAARLGWLPSYPQFNRNPLQLVKEAEAEGARSDEEIVACVVKRLRTGELRFAVEDPDDPANFPRVLFLWHANLKGASSKGHEYFLKHLLGAENAMGNRESPLRPEQVRWREPAPEGKLDLLVTLEIRMSTSALYVDIALPAAGWYEMHDINTTDMHSFIHPFTPAIDPPWEARTNWDQFTTLAAAFSRLAATHLTPCRDLVATPLLQTPPARSPNPRSTTGAGANARPFPEKPCCT